VPKASAEATIEGMNLIRYDALNIGAGELSFGVDFFQELQKKSLFPFVSANLFWEKNSQPLGEQFLIKEFGGLKVGITGILSPELLPRGAATQHGIVVEDPAKALKHVVAEIQKQADTIILLSYAGEVRTRSLLRDVPEIDIAIIGHSSGIFNEPLRARNTLLLKNAKKGMFLGVLEIALEPNASIVGARNYSMKILSKEVPSAPEAREILGKYHLAKRSSLKEQAKAKRTQELHEELLDQLNSMTPDEFLRKMQEDNPPPIPPE
jgi:2',3'-cyclic-nucleotide 2'-phosphodiesterase (5'-nucleotidase family)